MLSITTNTSSLIAQNSLKTSTSKLNQAIERMSTGSKINHAKDNAANYSIATNMTTKINALQVAEDNVNMGLDMLGALSEVLSEMETNLAKIRALAVQAQNGSYGSKSLAAMNSEANALMTEISRLNETAQYNGIKLFNTGKDEVTNAGKELKLNEQGFLQEVVVRDTSTMTKLSSVDETQALAQGTYSISTVEDLIKLNNMSKAGLLATGSEYVLENDIDLKEYCESNKANGGWTPISLSNGSIDGNGHTISNLYIYRPDRWYQGFFANSSVTSVKNLRLENVDITADSNVGGFVGGYIGLRQGSFVNCSVSGRIFAKGNYIGGIIGAGYYSSVNNCYANLSITGKDSVGGIYGFPNYSRCNSCFFEGSISGNSNIGGITGNGYDIGSRSKVIATIKGVSYVGGITGNGSIQDAYFDGSVIGKTNVGGISSNSSVSNCIMEGAVSGETNAGLLVGNLANSDSIKNCYYYKKNSNGLDISGTPNTGTLTNNIDITIPTEYSLQVGTSADSTRSSITLTTYVDFSALSEILTTGLEDKTLLEKVDTLINQVGLKQTEIGTAQNRLMSVLDEISTQYYNLVSSRSTIQDADIAEVSSEYIRQQILQQASATLMATANQSPALALQLL